MTKWSEETHTDRSQLRATVAEISEARCEHPIVDKARRVACRAPMVEMAHIYPRGMGHKGTRDYLNNVMAACSLHARSTDDLSSPEWEAVPPDGHNLRDSLTIWVKSLRQSKGWDV